MAEGEGFEPPVRFPVQRFSRPPVSTTHTSLRGECSQSSSLSAVAKKQESRDRAEQAPSCVSRISTPESRLSTAFSPRPPQQRHRKIRSNPRSSRRKADVGPVLRVADHGERRQQVPYAAPGRRRHSPLRRDRRIEHHVNRVRRRRRCKHSQAQPRINLEHTFTSLVDLSAGYTRRNTLSQAPRVLTQSGP